MNMRILSAISVVFLVLPGYGFALEVDREVKPRFTLGGRVLATLDNVDAQSDPAAAESINLEDSAFLLRLDKRLFERGVAGAVMGIGDDHGDARVKHAHVFYWDRAKMFTLGRQKLANTWIEFPLLRDDDLIDYTHGANASSDETTDHLDAELLRLHWFPGGGSQSVQAWTGARAIGTGFTGAAGFNSMGLAYHYELSESLRFLKQLRSLSLSVDRQQVETAAGRRDLDMVIAAASWNLNINPTYNWSMGVQVLINRGIDGATDLSSAGNRARAASTAWVAAIRLLNRPQLLTRWQAGITLAHKTFEDINDADQWSIVPSFFYRGGEGIDWVFQIKHTEYSGALFGGATDTTVQLGMVFNFNSVFNDTIGERDSILNLEHGYIQ